MTFAFFRSRRGAALACATVACAIFAAPARADIPAAQKTVLTHFLQALQARKYDAAFALLSKPEQTYFVTADNYASTYLADRVKIDSFQIVTTTQAQGATVAVVSEKLDVFSHKAQATTALVEKFAYGIVRTNGTLGIKDPYHPWRAIVPADWKASANDITVRVRKLSFYTGRVELLMTFENRGDTTVTILPYGRSVVRDPAGRVHQPIETKLAGLTDADLYRGVRLPPSSRFTGAMTFFTPDRYTPGSLSGTIAPVLADGGDAPFDLELPAYEIPR